MLKGARHLPLGVHVVPRVSRFTLAVIIWLGPAWFRQYLVPALLDLLEPPLSAKNFFSVDWEDGALLPARARRARSRRLDDERLVTKTAVLDLRGDLSVMGFKSGGNWDGVSCAPKIIS